MKFLLIPILLSVLSLVLGASANPMMGDRNVTFTCLGDGTVKVRVTLPENDTINNLFSTDVENRCSLSNGDFTGNGTEDSPYELTMNFTGYINRYPRPCGGKIVKDWVFVEFAIRTHEIFFGNKDNTYSVNCSLTKPNERVLETTLIRSSSSLVSMSLKLIDAQTGNDVKEIVSTNQNVKLRVELLSRHYPGAKVTLCYVRDSYARTPRKQFFFNKCSKQKSNPVHFELNQTNRKVMMSTPFKPVQYFKNNELKFICLVELCHKADDQYCLNNNCVPIGLFLHSYTEVSTSVYRVISGSNGISSSFDKFLPFLIFLTFFNYL